MTLHIFYFLLCEFSYSPNLSNLTHFLVFSLSVDSRLPLSLVYFFLIPAWPGAAAFPSILGHGASGLFFLVRVWLGLSGVGFGRCDSSRSVGKVKA